MDPSQTVEAACSVEAKPPFISGPAAPSGTLRWMATPRLRLGQLLVDAKLITNDDLEATLAVQKEDGRRLGTLLVERGLINETQLTQILSHQLSVPWVSLLHIEFSRQLLNLVPQDVADKFCLVPIYVRHVRNQGETLYVAMDDPSNEDGLKACSDYSGLPVRSMIAPPQDIRSAIRVYYGVAPRPPSQPAPPMSSAELAPPPAPPPPSFEATPKTEPVPEASPPVEETRASALDASDAPPPSVGRRAARISRHPVDDETGPRPRPVDDGPSIEAVEIQIPRASARPAPKQVEEAGAASEEEEAPPSAAGSPSERPVTTIPQPRGKTPRMVSLTLLDGTTISLPAKTKRGAEIAEPEPEPISSGETGTGLTARDLVTALRAVAQGADGSEVLGGEVRWESAFAALLSLLLKKHLIADWEFVDELKKIS
jgi:type IV pilus assembly protein PilB